MATVEVCKACKYVISMGILQWKIRVLHTKTRMYVVLWFIHGKNWKPAPIYVSHITTFAGAHTHFTSLCVWVLYRTIFDIYIQKTRIYAAQGVMCGNALAPKKSPIHGQYTFACQWVTGYCVRFSHRNTLICLPHTLNTIGARVYFRTCIHTMRSVWR